MSDKILVLLFLLNILASPENFLPEDRKGDWLHAGYLRFLNDNLTVYRVNNVLDYSAANDGTDKSNYKSINNAINDRDSGRLTLIYFPAGVYRISSPFTIENTGNLILRGEGSEKTKLVFNFNGQNNKTCFMIKLSEIIGIENLYIEREDSSDFGDNISIRSKNCWISGIESSKAVSSHITVYSSENIEIRGCNIHHAWNYGKGGHGYGIVLGNGTKKCLIEDNIFNHLRHSVILSNGPSLNVIGYNYSTDPYTTETYLGISDWPSDLCLHGHPNKQLKGPDRNLFEGNICAFMHADKAWYENGPYNTFFRNRATYYGLRIQRPSDSQNIIANEVDDSEGNLIDMAWNAFKIKSNSNYIIGNTNLDPAQDDYPSPEEYSSDLSLYFHPDSIPGFLKTLEFWPPIGVVDSHHRGGGTIPAKKRWDEKGVLTVLHAEHNVHGLKTLPQK
jgi:hypothetical protein